MRPQLKEFREALASLDTGKAGVLILTGSGGKAFVSGADIGDLRSRTKKQALEAINTGLFAEVENFAWPVIGAVNGFCSGRRLRVDAGLRHPDRERERPVRFSGDQPGDHSRSRRHAAPPPADGPSPRQGMGPDRRYL